MLNPSAPDATAAESPAEVVPQPLRTFAPTPMSWRLAILVGVAALGGLAYASRGILGPQGQAGFGILCFIGLAASLSRNLRAVNWGMVGWGIALQVFLALAVTTTAWYWVVVQSLFFVALAVTSLTRRYVLNRPNEPQWLPIVWAGLAVSWLAAGLAVPGWVQWSFQQVGDGIGVLIACSDQGAEFVFGDLAKANGPTAEPFGAVIGGPGAVNAAERQIGVNKFHFAFKALPPIIFVSAFFSVLYYFGVLQFLVKLFARGMMYLMGTSGAETLSVAANVFMGQTEAPLIVKPFVPRMTESELFTLMVSGMATISGGMMAVYISFGADPVAILCTSVMACPCSLYLAKLVLPETARPVTAGDAEIVVEKGAVNPIDAAATGIKDGLFLALNVAAMLIGFLAFIALFDAILGAFRDGLSLRWIFGQAFSPVAFLIGVDPAESAAVGELLGTKLAANEAVAYLDLQSLKADGRVSERSHTLAVYALTGFANFASIGIQLGGIGALAPDRRKDLARLGLNALFVGFVVTLINAAVAGVLLAG